MMKYIFFFLLTGNFFSCDDNRRSNYDAGTNTSADTEKPGSSDVNLQPDGEVSGCYMKINGRDTAILMLEQKGNDISGKMLYDNHEKDGSSGTVKGKEEKEIIKLWYDFQSEGIRSVMEVYFKKESGRVLRGIGSMDVKTDTTYFISGINYSDKEAFNKVDCASIEWKLNF